MDPETLAAIESVLATDRRPWRPISEFLGEVDLIEVTFQKSSTGAMDRLEAAAEEAGLKVERHEVIALSSNVGEFVMLALKTVHDLSLVGGGLLALAKLPDGLAKLRTVLAPHLGRAIYANPILHLEPVGSWLDKKYGQGRWRLDPDRITTWKVQEATLFKVYETKSDTWHLLSVVGDEVIELPAKVVAAAD